MSDSLRLPRYPPSEACEATTAKRDKKAQILFVSSHLSHLTAISAGMRYGVWGWNPHAGGLPPAPLVAYS
jgi:hypothetical protein